MSFLVVGDLLEETISRTAAKSQSGGADGELAWLRKRLVNERRDPGARGKLALEIDSIRGGSSSNQQARSMTKTGSAPADKENGGGGVAATTVTATPAGSRANKVRSLRCRANYISFTPCNYAAGTAVFGLSLNQHSLVGLFSVEAEGHDGHADRVNGVFLRCSRPHPLAASTPPVVQPNLCLSRFIYVLLYYGCSGISRLARNLLPTSVLDAVLPVHGTE